MSESSIVVTTETTSEQSQKSNNDEHKSANIYTYLLIAVVIVLIVFIIYHSYTCFYKNQENDIFESYINEQPRSDPQDDKSFDVSVEVKKLIQLQEQYLAKLQRSRLGN